MKKLLIVMFALFSAISCQESKENTSNEGDVDSVEVVIFEDSVAFADSIPA